MPTRCGVSHWLRALLALPITVAAFVLIAGEGGQWALPTDALSGGDAPGLLWFYTIIGTVGMALFAFVVLIACACFVVSGLSGFGGPRLTTIALFLAITGAFASFQFANWKMRGEIGAVARSGLVNEQIPKEHWRVEACGRGQYVCVYWHGHLGASRVKGYMGASQTAAQALEGWRHAHKQGTALEVEWGKTPVGWIAARTATVGEFAVHNGW